MRSAVPREAGGRVPAAALRLRDRTRQGHVAACVVDEGQVSDCPEKRPESPANRVPGHGPAVSGPERGSGEAGTRNFQGL